MTIHGGDVWRWGDCPPLDFSANLNPLGMAPEVREAALQGVTESVHYPDPRCAALNRALCAQTGMPEEWIFWDSGAVAVLERAVAALRPGRALLFCPCFGEYERILEQYHWTIERHFLRPEEGFDLTETALERLSAGLNLVIVCSPNNPTGRCAEAGVLHRLLRRCGELDVRVMVDESFLPLTDSARRTDLLPLLSSQTRLLLLRSMTKSHCIPGLRLGYALSADRQWMERMRRQSQPWRVSVPAQRAGAAALRRADWPERAVELVKRERTRLTEGLRALGCTVWDSHTNFLLFRAAGDSRLRERLLERGVLIRGCGDFRGLGPDYYRTAVRLPAENQTLLEALEKVLRRDEL